MTTKPTIGKLRRENERLKARIVELEMKIDRHMAAYRDNLYSVVDAETRIKQAIEVLTGESE